MSPEEDQNMVYLSRWIGDRLLRFKDALVFFAMWIREVWPKMTPRQRWAIRLVLWQIPLIPLIVVTFFIFDYPEKYYWVGIVSCWLMTGSSIYLTYHPRKDPS
jgi:hypothetical protein